MNGKIRVLGVSHSCLVAENHKLWDHLAEDAELQLTLLVPPRYRAALRDHLLEKTHDPQYRIVPAETLLSRNRFSNHLHFYTEKIRRALHETPPDVIYVQEEPWTLSMQQVVLLRNRRSRLLFCTAQNKTKRYPFPFNVFRRNAFRVSDAAVAVCEEARDVLERQGFDKPVHVLPLGVDTESFVPSEGRRVSWRRRLGLEGFVVGYVGRLTAAKGVFDLLGALARLGPDFRLLIIGDGPDRKSFLRRAAELGLDGRVILAGLVSHSDVPALMPAMDALVLPSHTTRAWKEQFGRVLIEAMACGVPVVGSSSGEIPKTIGEAGIVFPETDEAALADALVRLRSSAGLRESLVNKGIAHARGFSWRAVARRLGGIFRQVLNTPERSGGALPATG